MPMRVALLLNALWFQSIWWITVLSGNRFLALVTLLLIGHVMLCKDIKTELSFLALGTLLGAGIDSVLTIADIFVFEPKPSLLPIPLWLVALWCGFLGTMRHSLSHFLKRPYVLTLLSCIFAPLSYFAAMKLGAVHFAKPLSTVAPILVITWALLTPLLLLLNGTLEKRGQLST